MYSRRGIPRIVWNMWEKCERLMDAIRASSLRVKLSPACSPRKSPIRFMAAAAVVLGAPRLVRDIARLIARRRAAAETVLGR